MLLASNYIVFGIGQIQINEVLLYYDYRIADTGDMVTHLVYKI
jgi:hypothetical protein